ncbi:hypothetical protein BH20GEM2_BH20GEM2_13010 [soil metagenome]
MPDPIPPDGGESETLLATEDHTALKQEEPPPAATPVAERRSVQARKSRSIRQLPLLKLLAYYLVLIGGLWLLVAYVPVVGDAVIAPVGLPVTSEASALLGGAPAAPVPVTVEPGIAGNFGRGLKTLIVTLAALALVLPVGWVYMFTKRLEFDPSLVQSVIILPIVVAGILLVVKNSLALAFSLAGIVAAVRFRNTLKDPRDAVYIFLAIGIGLACGVQAVDVAVVMSLAFNVVVLMMWKWNVGSLYSAPAGPVGVLWATGAPKVKKAKKQFLCVGDPALVVGRTPKDRKKVRKGLEAHVGDMETNGILVVHTAQPEEARAGVEEVLAGDTKDWKLATVEPGDSGVATLQYLLRFKKKSSPVDVLNALDERWSAHVVAAEYIPFKRPKKK